MSYHEQQIGNSRKNDNEIYCERIRELREEYNKKQQELAKYLNIAQNTYSQYENGKRELPIAHLISLCRFYKVSSDYILGLSNMK